MRAQNKKDATISLVEHVDGRTFESFCCTFDKDRQSARDGKDYIKVKKALVHQFGKKIVGNRTLKGFRGGVGFEKLNEFIEQGDSK